MQYNTKRNKKLKALYVGILTDGTTSRMREQTLRSLTPFMEWSSIDTDKGFRQSRRLWKTLAFRIKAGPLVNQINKEVISFIEGNQYDLIWVDKGVYLWRKTVGELRKRTKKLAHYTPDTAFFANRSRHFYDSIHYYDLLVTTKSFELDQYRKFVDKGRIYLTTQSYDEHLHRKSENINQKHSDVVFIGLNEKDREECIEALLTAGIPVRLGGRGWRGFVKKHSTYPNLHFLGSEVFGADYVTAYTSASIGLGLLSKKFPELHTTRTFEIPACGTLLATERTSDTTRFFSASDVLFFDGCKNLADQVKNLFEFPEKIEEISRKGHDCVTAGGFDNSSVISEILKRLSFLL